MKKIRKRRKTRYPMTVSLPHQVNLFGFQQEVAGCRPSSFCKHTLSVLIRKYGKIQEKLHTNKSNPKNQSIPTLLSLGIIAKSKKN